MGSVESFASKPAQPVVSVAQSTRDRMLDQGVLSLIESGYHGSGLGAMLRSAGVPKGSFYHYFESKDDFAAAVIGHYIQPFLDQLEAALARVPSMSGALILENYFEGLIQTATSVQFRGGCLLGNLMGELGDGAGPLSKAALRDAVSRYVDVIERVLSRGIQDGTLKTPEQPRNLAERLVDHWQGALLRAKLEGSERPLRQCLGAFLGGGHTLS